MNVGNSTGFVVRKRIGILGGTFDPPHKAHLLVASALRRCYGFDRLLLVVANDPWQKSMAKRVTAAEDRWAMLEAAVRTLASDGIDGVEASRIEIERGGPSFTIDTVEQIRSESAQMGVLEPEIGVIVGADLVAGLSSWDRVDELQRLVTLFVIARPGTITPSIPNGWKGQILEVETLDVSSSIIRSRLMTGVGVDDLVPSEVIRYIKSHGLYTGIRS